MLQLKHCMVTMLHRECRYGWEAIAGRGGRECMLLHPWLVSQLHILYNIVDCWRILNYCILLQHCISKPGFKLHFSIFKEVKHVY